MTLTRRALLHAALLGTVGLAARAAGVRADAEEIFWCTGYVHTGQRTASGEVTYGQEWAICAAHPRLSFGSVVEIDGLGTFTVQDRGFLGWNHIDILVGSVSEARQVTGSYSGRVVG